ncbi:hypothetical protein [Marinobacterium litorale]|uniref:hypothetical protein n=1 Tax=Marinobacterium litorale TaxID=404770 RepID=UPI000423AEB2|nr:hypothetical protein [Marinobacterium litorale]
MKCSHEACSATGPMSPLFRDFQNFLQSCIDELDQLCEQEDSASANQRLSESNAGSDNDR